LPTIRIPLDPRKKFMGCEEGKHALPVVAEGGLSYDWEATEEEYIFWWRQPKREKNDLIRRQFDYGCFLCTLDKTMP
jgi:hypothetical protein